MTFMSHISIKVSLLSYLGKKTTTVHSLAICLDEALKKN